MLVNGLGKLKGKFTKPTPLSLMFSLRFRVKKKNSYHARTLMEPQKVSVLLNRARVSV